MPLDERSVVEIAAGPLAGRYRVIWIEQEVGGDGCCVLIKIDGARLHKPMWLARTYLAELEAHGRLHAVSENVDPRSLLTDEELNADYPSDKTVELSFVVSYRKKWRSVVEQIMPHLPRVWRKEVSFSKLFDKLFPNQRNKKTLYEVIYRFLANGARPGGVLPQTSQLGTKKRAGKKKSDGSYSGPLGRPRTEGRATSPANFILKPLDIQRIKVCYQGLIAAGYSHEDAYNIFCALYYPPPMESEGYRHGAQPSKRQFLTHGPGVEYEQELNEQISRAVNRSVWRPSTTPRSDATYSAGRVGTADGTSSDLYFRSLFNRMAVLPPYRLILVVEFETGYISGYYLGSKLNSDAARLALLHSAPSKVEYCARFGIEIKEDDWIPILYRELYVDHGEFNCEAMRFTFRNLESSIVYTRSGVPEDRGIGENKNKVAHLQTLPGATHGRNRRRGEPDPAAESVLNLFEYNRLLIRAILRHNNVIRLKRLLRAEMGEIDPTRKNVLLWAKEHGYFHSASFLYPDLIVELCPLYVGSVRGNHAVIIFRRDGKSGDELALEEFKYMPTGALLERWMFQYRKTGQRFRVDLRVNPFDLSKVWLVDRELGLQTLLLDSQDRNARNATLEDAIFHNIRVSQEVARAAGQERAAKVEEQAERMATTENAKRELDDPRRGRSGRVGRTADGRRQNRKLEEERIGSSPTSNPVPPESLNDAGPSDSSRPASGSEEASNCDVDPARAWVDGREV